MPTNVPTVPVQESAVSATENAAGAAGGTEAGVAATPVANTPVAATEGPAGALDIHANRSLIFQAGGAMYSCDVEAVCEIVPAGPITRLPGAPDYVPGIINVRGVIVTVVDAGLYLHGRSCAAGGSVMLVDVGVRSVGLLVDSVSDVRVVRPDETYQTLDVRAAVARVIAITEDE